MLQRERRHVECVQNNECKREVSTSHDHTCSQPTSERRAAATSIPGRDVGLDFGLRPPAFDLRPSGNLMQEESMLRGPAGNKHKIKRDELHEHEKLQERQVQERNKRTPEGPNSTRPRPKTKKEPKGQKQRPKRKSDLCRAEASTRPKTGLKGSKANKAKKQAKRLG